MVKLDISFAITATCIEEYNNRRSPEWPIRIKPHDVRTCASRLSEKANIVVVNGFYAKDIIENLRKTNLMKQVQHALDIDGNPVFELNINRLAKRPE